MGWRTGSAGLLDDWTGERWSVEAVDGDDAAPSLREQREEREAAERRQAIDHPAVQAALEVFPGATVEAVRSVEPAPILGEAPQEPPADAEDEPEAGSTHGELAAMKNFGQLMKQAQEMQSKIQDMQDRLADIEVTGQSGAGLVTVTMNAKNEVRRVEIDPSLFNAEDVSVVEDLIVAAFTDAKGKAESRASEEMQKIAGGLNLPPGLNLPF